MKLCEYCGRENDETASHCSECGTAFLAEPRGSVLEVVRWRPSSPLAVAVTRGLGALLVSTGLYYIAGRVMLDIYSLVYRDEFLSQLPTSTTGLYTPLVMFRHHTGELLGVAGVVFAGLIAGRGIGRTAHSLITGLITAVVSAILLFGPRLVPGLLCLLWLVPTMTLGMATGLSVAYYFGGALQLLCGAWLLGWLGSSLHIP